MKMEMSTLSEQLNSAASFFITGIKVDFTNYDTIVDLIDNAIKQEEKFIINYVNAYSIVVLNKDDDFRTSLKASNLIHSDGVGIWLALKILHKWKSPVRFNWTDCSFNFLRTCEEKEWKIFFLGSTEKVLKKAKGNLRKKFPHLKLMGSLNGYERLNDKSLVETINRLNVDILYVGLGTPKQEIWIYNNAPNLNCKVIQSVGDLFNLFAEKKIRGPKLFQKIGLEWFFRLLRHPVKYFNRYTIGIPRFFIILIKEFLNKKSGK